MRLLAIDTETTGVAWDDDAFMISVAFMSEDAEMHSRVWDAREESSLPGSWYDIITETIPNLFNSHDKIIMHNAKFDIQKLLRLGVSKDYFTDTNRWEDTQAIAHLYNEQESTALKYLAKKYLGEETDENEALKAYRRKNKLTKADGYDKIPYEILAPYAAKDAEYTLRLYHTLNGPWMVRSADLYEMEKELTIALLDIEAAGLRVDADYVKENRREYGDRIYKLKCRIGDIAGEEFNPQSHQQVTAALKERGFVVSSTSKDTLSSLDDELAQLILQLREANKIKTTYFDALFNEAREGLLHPNFRQHGTRTGRMSSGAAVA